MNFDSSKGSQLDTTEVDVVETKPIPPPPKPAPPKKANVPEKVVTEKIPEEIPEEIPETKPPQELPSKEIKEEITEDQPEVDPQGTMPVAAEIPEEVHKEFMEEPAEAAPEEAVKKDVALDNPPEVAPPESIPPTATTDQAYGTPVGNQSEPLVPFGTNKSHTYPYLARFRKYEGVTVVHYTVSPSGDVIDAKVVSSSGHSVLDDEAVGTIKTWKFKPMRNEVVYEKYVRFQLRGNAKEAPSLLRRSKKTN
jgi:protein TonB